MNTTTKLKMTDNNITKNLKRLNEKSAIEQRNELLNYAHIKNGQTVTTDSKRALKINQIVENDFTREDIENFDRIDKLFTESSTDYNYKISLNRTQVDELRKIAKLLKSVGQSVRITYDKGNVTISNHDSSKKYLDSLKLSYRLLESDTDNSQLEFKDGNIKTVINAQYFADMLDFVYDNKDEQTTLIIQESSMRPIYMRPYLRNWESYDYMVMPIRVY